MVWWWEERGLGLHSIRWSAFLWGVPNLQTSALIWTTLMSSDGDQFSYHVWAAFFPSHFPSSLHTSMIEVFETIMLNCKNRSLLEKEIPASMTVLSPFWPNSWGSESLLSFWWQTFCRCLGEYRMTHKPCSSSILRSQARRKLPHMIGEAKSTSRFTCLHGSICWKIHAELNLRHEKLFLKVCGQMPYVP